MQQHCCTTKESSLSFTFSNDHLLLDSLDFLSCIVITKLEYIYSALSRKHIRFISFIRNCRF